MIETRVSGRAREAAAPLVFAAFSFRFDADLVPALIENISPIVDGWVSWDDRGASEAYSSEPERRRALIGAARQAGAQWLLAVDPDERFEDRLAAEIRAMTSVAAPLGWTFDLREMYTPEAFRVDGLWGQKRQMRLFPLNEATAANDAALHGRWVSGQDDLQVRSSGLNLYHLRMILPERRRQLYASLDPGRRFQPMGYDYLTDETGLELEAIPPGRGFSPAHREDGGLWAAGTVPGTAVDPDPLASRFERIRPMRKMGASRLTQNVTRQLAEQHPQAIVPQVVQVATAVEAGDIHDAQAVTERLHQVHGDRPWVLWLNARVLGAAGERTRAQEVLDRLLAREPGMVPAGFTRHAMAEGVERFAAADAPWRRWARGASVLREGSAVARADIAVVVLSYLCQISSLIRECIGCNIFVTADFLKVPLRCTQNPTMGEEWRKGWHPERIAPRKADETVLVIGAGPAGLEATRALGQRGYRVTLAEAGRELGGRVAIESRQPGLSEWRRVADHRILQIGKMANVEVFRESRLTAAEALEFNADRILVATGSRWRSDGIGRAITAPLRLGPGSQVLTPDDIMAGRLPNQGPVVIFDDDHYYMGGLMAEVLRAKGLEVALVTPAPDVSNFTHNTLEQGRIQGRLMEQGGQIVTNHSVAGLGGGELTVTCGYTGRQRQIAAAVFVPVTMRLPEDGLHAQIAKALDQGVRAPKSLLRIGDCLSPGTIAAAVYSGHRHARELGEPVGEGVPFRREMPHLAAL